MKKLKPLLYAFVLVPLVVCAADRADPYDAFRADSETNSKFNEDYIEPWKESDVKVPKLNLETLRLLDIDHGPIDARVLIDASTVDVNEEDRVVRYWMVIESHGHYGSMTYEGLRCSTREYKSYAYVSANHPEKIRQLKTPKWRAIHRNIRDPHYEIAEDYLCNGHLAKTKRGLAAALKGYGSIRPAAELTDL